MDDRYMTVDEFATKARIGAGTIRRWIRSGKLHAVMIGGTKLGYRIPRNEYARICDLGPDYQDWLQSIDDTHPIVIHLRKLGVA